MTKLSVVQQLVFAFLLLAVANQVNAKFVNAEKKSVYNVAVIGAGVCGLLSTKHSVSQGFNVTVYEQTEQIGGIWWYTDKTGKDKYGVNIHSPMYQGLR